MNLGAVPMYHTPCLSAQKKNLFCSKYINCTIDCNRLTKLVNKAQFEKQNKGTKTHQTLCNYKEVAKILRAQNIIVRTFSMHGNKCGLTKRVN